MRDGLAAVLAHIDDHTPAVLGQAFLFRYFLGGLHQVSQQRRVGLIGLL